MEDEIIQDIFWTPSANFFERGFFFELFMAALQILRGFLFNIAV